MKQKKAFPGVEPARRRATEARGDPIFHAAMKDVHPRGFYRKCPEVTWDLAYGRYLGHIGRHSYLLNIAYCGCGWHWYCSPHSDGMVEAWIPAIPERRRVTEWLIASRHWYECPDRAQHMHFIWMGYRTEPEVGHLDCSMPLV